MLTMDCEAELAKAPIERIKSRFDRLDHCRIKNRESVMLRIRR